MLLPVALLLPFHHQRPKPADGSPICYTDEDAPLLAICVAATVSCSTCVCACVCVHTYICVHVCQLPPVPMLQAETANSLMKCLQTGKVAALHLGHLTCEAGVGLLPPVALRLVHMRRDM